MRRVGTLKILQQLTEPSQIISAQRSDLGNLHAMREWNTSRVWWLCVTDRQARECCWYIF